ncbi:MAG: MBOAT family protein [Lachnospiraceae bacterium]|nr:MBOAT family protein [Lachnospiraceae bacterium]
MVFSSNLFIFFFLPLTIWGYFFLGKRFQNIFLLLMSTIFFAWSQPNYLWLIWLNIFTNYLCALFIAKFSNAVMRRLFLISALIVNLGLLVYFKYFNFLIDSANNLFHMELTPKNIILPIGISFFTFQGLSYVIDVYRKNVAVQKNLFKVALYILFFPQLIAGPIVKYSDVELQINHRDVSLNDFSVGLKRFIIGLGKKAILANTLAVMVDNIWNYGVAHYTVAIAWLGCIGYTLQIYFDFAGYSDMAIGLGRIFGFHFNENFNLPYISKSITEFWRRWHISLSTWFREYVYIPLGGNRKHVYLNLTIVFLLTGIWHGAAWNYILWGIWHGIFILAERYVKKNNICILKKGQNIISRIYTLSVVGIGWVLFRADNLDSAITYLKAMFGISLSTTPGFDVFWYLNKWNVTILIIAIILSTELPGKLAIRIRNTISENTYFIVEKIFLLLLFTFSLIRIVAGTYNPFIYFQF